MRALQKLMLKLCAAAVAACPIAASAQDRPYVLGQGLAVGDLNISGYANIVAEFPHGAPGALVADDLSLFMSGRFNRVFNPFIEAEITDAEVWREGDPILRKPDPAFALERLYNDSILTPDVTLRLGKMLTPVGQWNTIHAGPLVSTTTRPLTTYRSFPEYATGVSVLYASASSGLPEVQVYAQPAGELAPRNRSKEPRDYRSFSGLHANFPFGFSDKLGFSLQQAAIAHSAERQTLLGSDVRASIGPLLVEAEANYLWLFGANPARVRDHEWSGFAQLSYSVTEEVALFSRYELFRDRAVRAISRNAVLGVSYRPTPPMVWKFEWVEQSGANLGMETGLYASFAVLF